MVRGSLSFHFLAAFSSIHLCPFKLILKQIVRPFPTLNIDRLGFKAFHTILSQRQTSYRVLIRKLDFDLKMGKNRQWKGKFRRIVKEGMQDMPVRLAF